MLGVWDSVNEPEYNKVWVAFFKCFRNYVRRKELRLMRYEMWDVDKDMTMEGKEP
jgi:hypothetical protein